VVISALPHRAVVQRVTSIFDLSDATNYDRVCMAYAGWGMIRERPLLGQGPRMVQERYPIYRHPTAPRYSVPHLHNSYLQLAAERGLPSLLAMLALVAVSLRRAWRDFRSQGGRSGPRADLYVGVFCSLAGFLVAGLFEDNWNDTEVQRIVLFLLALPFCLAQSRELDNEEPGGPEESTSPSLPPS
jgi:O-antigen ligase